MGTDFEVAVTVLADGGTSSSLSLLLELLELLELLLELLSFRLLFFRPEFVP